MEVRRRAREQGAAVALLSRRAVAGGEGVRVVYASGDMDGQPFLQVSRTVLGRQLGEREEEDVRRCKVLAERV